MIGNEYPDPKKKAHAPPRRNEGHKPEVPAPDHRLLEVVIRQRHHLPPTAVGPPATATAAAFRAGAAAGGGTGGGRAGVACCFGWLVALVCGTDHVFFNTFLYVRPSVRPSILHGTKGMNPSISHIIPLLPLSRLLAKARACEIASLTRPLAVRSPCGFI